MQPFLLRLYFAAWRSQFLNEESNVSFSVAKQVSYITLSRTMIKGGYWTTKGQKAQTSGYAITTVPCTVNLAFETSLWVLQRESPSQVWTSNKNTPYRRPTVRSGQDDVTHACLPLSSSSSVHCWRLMVESVKLKHLERLLEVFHLSYAAIVCTPTGRRRRMTHPEGLDGHFSE